MSVRIQIHRRFFLSTRIAGCRPPECATLCSRPWQLQLCWMRCGALGLLQSVAEKGRAPPPMEQSFHPPLGGSRACRTPAGLEIDSARTGRMKFAKSRGGWTPSSIHSGEGERVFVIAGAGRTREMNFAVHLKGHAASAITRTSANGMSDSRAKALCLVSLARMAAGLAMPQRNRASCRGVASAACF